MKKFAIALVFSLPALAQSGAGWIRGQYVDKLTGNIVTTYQLPADPDGSNRKPYIAMTCDLAAKRFTYGYFTDEMVAVDPRFASVSSTYYPTMVSYRADSNKPKKDDVTVRPDFRTINIDQGILMAASGGSEFAISFPSERGYEITDVFHGGPLPQQYASDCYTEKMRRKSR